MQPRQPLNAVQRRILVFSLAIILLLAVLYFLFFGDLGGREPAPSPTPEATFATVIDALDNLPTPTPPPTPAPTPEPTATPAPTPSPIPPPEQITSLKKGSKGTEVVNLQARLIQLGYLPAGSNDGSFGTATEEAVKAFQLANGLKNDGIAGRDTQTRLFSPEAKPR